MTNFWHAGDPCKIAMGETSANAKVVLASTNNRSLLVLVDEGDGGVLPLLLHDDGEYHSVFTSEVVHIWSLPS